MSWLSNAWNGVSSWLGNNVSSLIGTAVNGVISWLGMKNQNENVDKQLEAQATENQAIRDYNYQLWQDENAYNTPAAQKARLEQAGLNSDLMYGGSGVMNTASSPSPVSPMDWSAISGKRTIGDVAMQTLAMQQAQANIRKTNAEASRTETDDEILKQYGLDYAALQNEEMRARVHKLAVEAQSIDLDIPEKQLKQSFMHTYREKIVENMLQRLETSTGLSRNELKEDCETLALRIAGLNADNSRIVRQSSFTEGEWGLVLDVVKFLIQSLK